MNSRIFPAYKHFLFYTIQIWQHFVNLRSVGKIKYPLFKLFLPSSVHVGLIGFVEWLNLSSHIPVHNGPDTHWRNQFHCLQWGTLICPNSLHATCTHCDVPQAISHCWNSNLLHTLGHSLRGTCTYSVIFPIDHQFRFQKMWNKPGACVS